MAALLNAVDRLGGVQDRGVEQSQVQIDVIVGDVLQLGIEVAEEQRIEARHLAAAVEERVVASVHPDPPAQNMAPDARERGHVGLDLVGVRHVAKAAAAEIGPVGQPRIVDPIEIKVAAVPGDGVAAGPRLGAAVGGGAIPTSCGLHRRVGSVYSWLSRVASPPSVGDNAGIAGIAGIAGAAKAYACGHGEQRPADRA